MTGIKIDVQSNTGLELGDPMECIQIDGRMFARKCTKEKATHILQILDLSERRVTLVPWDFSEKKEKKEERHYDDLDEDEIRAQAYEECAKIAESYVRFATHNPHCLEIVEEIRLKIVKETAKNQSGVLTASQHTFKTSAVKRTYTYENANIFRQKMPDDMPLEFIARMFQDFLDYGKCCWSRDSVNGNSYERIHP